VHPPGFNHFAAVLRRWLRPGPATTSPTIPGHSCCISFRITGRNHTNRSIFVCRPVRNMAVRAQIAAALLALVQTLPAQATLPEFRRALYGQCAECVGVVQRPDWSHNPGVPGTAYHSNAFIRSKERRAGDYVKQAGEPTRNTDKGRACIIQADGSVLPKQDLGSSIGRKKLNPGSTVVIPEHALKSTFISIFRDRTQVFFQMGLTAAMIAALR
jgi:hypothetical protein